MAIHKVEPMTSSMDETTNRLEKEGQRMGQAFFNALVVHNPALAEEIRGTADDPFYVEDDDECLRLTTKLLARIP